MKVSLSFPTLKQREQACLIEMCFKFQQQSSWTSSFVIDFLQWSHDLFETSLKHYNCTLYVWDVASSGSLVLVPVQACQIQ